MTTDSTKRALNIRNCPKGLHKRLKMMAVSRDMDLQDLAVEYLQYAIDRAEGGAFRDGIEKKASQSS